MTEPTKVDLTKREPIKLNKQQFAKLLKQAMKNHSLRKVAKELEIDHMILWRATQGSEVTLNHFILILEYIQRRTLLTYDQIFRQLY